MENLEYRTVLLDNVSIDKEKRTITGKAIVYNSTSKELRTSNGSKFKEIILPGALTDSLKNNDICALREHNPQMILGRVSAGTLKLEDREDGLYCSIDMPDTTYGNDTLVSAQRGDLKGFSFGFNPIKQRMFSRGDEKIREISALDCREVSIVGNPAYGATTMAVRSEDFVPEPKKEEVKKVEERTVDMESYKRKTSFYSHNLRGITSCKKHQTNK